MNYLVYCDGGSRGNPGPAGIGFVVYDNRGKVLTKGAKFIGETTNNVAEYSAVIAALKWLVGKRASDKSTDKTIPLRIKFLLDSMLVVNQLNGFFKIKNAVLRTLAVEVRQWENSLCGQVSYHFIPREKNKTADNLVNQIINKKTG